MNFLTTFATQAKQTAIETIKHELSLRALSNISEARFDVHMAHPVYGVMTIDKNVEADDSESAENKYKGTDGQEVFATESPFSGKEGKTDGTEGDVHRLEQSPEALAAKLGLQYGALADNGAFSPTSTITGVDGSTHHIYTNNGEARIRPVNATPEQTEDLKRYLGEDPNWKCCESVEAENNRTE